MGAYIIAAIERSTVDVEFPILRLRNTEPSSFIILHPGCAELYGGFTYIHTWSDSWKTRETVFPAWSYYIQ